MNKTELTDRLSKKTGMSKAEAKLSYLTTGQDVDSA